MKYAYMIFWTMRPHKYEWWTTLSQEERQKKQAERQKKQAEAMKKHGFELDYWGPAWGADHDYVTVVKSDKAPEDLGAFMTEWNGGWIKTKTTVVSII
jgi:hypothetical protein